MTMAIPREHPYIWVTWITGLLAGDRSCLWSAWYRAHFKDYERKPTGIDLATWTAVHGEMVRTRAEALRAAGDDVYVEDQNKFSLRGRAATLGGKPDLVAIQTAGEGGQADARRALVVDCKSGKQRTSDYFQVLTYMLVLPHTHPACRGIPVAGELQYRDTSVPIEPEKLTPELRRLIRTTIEQVGGDAEPVRVPSAAECRFCDLCVGDCPDRVEEDETGGAARGRGPGPPGTPPAQGAGHDLF